MKPPAGDPVSGVRDFYEDEAAVGHYSRGAGLLPKEQRAIGHFPSGGRVLDLGCGAGRTTTPLVATGFQVTAVDISAAMVRAARSREPGAQFAVADAAALPFADGSFDAVLFSFNGIDFIYPYSVRLNALREIRRVLVPGGVFAFSTHNPCLPRDRVGWAPFLRAWFGVGSGYMASRYPWGTVPMFIGMPRSQVQELHDAGFAVTEVVRRKGMRFVPWLGLSAWFDCYFYYVCTTIGAAL